MARIADGPSSEQRRQQIMDAALRVFASRGYSGATNKDIAHEAGITPGLIYHYFADKRALFDALCNERNPIGITLGMLAGEAMQEREPREVLHLLIATLIARLEASENVCVMRILMGEAMRDPETKALFNANSARVVDIVAGYLRGQMERGRLRPLDPTLVAQFLVGGLVQTVVRRAVTADPVMCRYSPEQIATTLVELALDGLERGRTCRPASPPVGQVAGATA